MLNKICSVCKQPFETKIASKNLCSWLCKMEHNRRNSRYYSRQKRLKRVTDPCEICGFKITTDRHKEGNTITVLCPNHHCMITRGIKTLEELLKEKGNS